MKKMLKKLASFSMVLSLMMGVFAAPVEVYTARKEGLNKSKVTLIVGESVKLKFKNVPAGNDITWSSNKKAVAEVNKNGKVKAKKAGTARIAARMNGKTYYCKVTVKKKTADNNTIVLSDTEGKNTNDVKILMAIIQEQNVKGARLSTGLNSESYKWDEKGNLIGIDWSESLLRDSLSLNGLDELSFLNCNCNELNSLDVSENVALTSLQCYSNKLSSLKVSKNAALTSLDCNSNQLSSLDLSGCTALKQLNCVDNQLSSIDVSSCAALARLDCDDNVTVIGNSAVRLKYLQLISQCVMTFKESLIKAFPAPQKFLVVLKESE